MSFNLTAVLILGLFYLAFFVVGALAGRSKQFADFDEFLLAGRNLPLMLGVCTMIATWVGGGYLNGTAEAVYDRSMGLVWAQAPWGYALSLILGGLLFAGKMRDYGFRTLLDLFEGRYGYKVAAVLFIPALMGEVFWSAAILAALGTSLGTLLGFDFTLSILVSAGVAIGYTLLGGLRSVAFTDLLQLLLIVFGLGLAVPFALQNVGGFENLMEGYLSSYGEAASPVPPLTAWTLDRGWGWQWADWALLLVFGGIPWQVYFQRVLACQTSARAVQLSVLAGFGCLLIAIPAGLMGAIGGVVDWSSIPAGPPEQSALALPWVLKNLTPPLIGIIGLSAIAAAVMSSVDSSVLSAASMFTWNVYRPLKSAEESTSLKTVIRIAILGVGFMATALALKVGSVYTLWALCGDVVYVILFPQLVMALYFRKSNTIGAILGAIVGFILRAGGGEPSLGIPSFLPYPGQDPELGLLFPFRTFSMILSLLTIWVASTLTQTLDPAREIDTRAG